jgi:hypothetical protein
MLFLLDGSLAPKGVVLLDVFADPARAFFQLLPLLLLLLRVLLLRVLLLRVLLLLLSLLRTLLLWRQKSLPMLKCALFGSSPPLIVLRQTRLVIIMG